ncbi:MAG TPA: MCE family protein [Planctomycetes bacterium]|nr:MCE family protein [Planctomycetota bacterium]
MRQRSRSFKVGLFLLSSAGLLLLLLFLAIGASLRTEKKTYIIHFMETVKGMVIGSPVNFQGVRIGNVVDMRFSNGVTEVSVEVDPRKAPIQKVTRASLDRAWVTGQVTVELSGYEKDGEEVPEYGLIQASLSPTAQMASSLPQAMKGISSLLANLNDVTRRLGLLLKDENLDRIAALMDRGEHLMETMDGRLARVLDRLEGKSLPELEGLMGDSRKLLTPFRRNLERVEELLGKPELEAALARSDAIARNLEGTLQGAKEVSTQLGRFLGGNRLEWAQLLRNLRVAVQEFQGLARTLRSSPRALIFGSNRKARVQALPASSGREE